MASEAYNKQLEIEKLNKDKKVNGVIVQLPLPEGMDETKIVNIVSSHTKYIFCKSGNNWLAIPISYPMVQDGMNAELFKRIIVEMKKRHYQYSCEV